MLQSPFAMPSWPNAGSKIAQRPHVWPMILGLVPVGSPLYLEQCAKLEACQCTRAACSCCCLRYSVGRIHHHAGAGSH